MADGRLLRKKASRDPRLAQLTEPSALLYVLSIPHLDVEGRMIGLPVWVRGNVVPAFAEQRPQIWTDEFVAGYMLEWTHTADPDGTQRPLVLWYAVAGESVCWFPGFCRNQTLRRDREAPSRLPAPPPDVLAQHGLASDGSRIGGRARSSGSPPGAKDKGEVEVQAGMVSRDQAACAREAGPETLPVADIVQASLSAVAASGQPSAPEPSLPDELATIAARVRSDPDGNEVNPKTLGKLHRAGLPPAAFARAYEALEERRRRRPPLRSEPRYFVAALKSMLDESQYGRPAA